MFWTVLEISGNAAVTHGVYADRNSAFDALETYFRNIKPNDFGLSKYFILEWLSVYGYNRVLNADGSEIVGKTFYQWVHADGNSNEKMDAIIHSCSSAVMQWAAMMCTGSFSK